MEKIFTAIYLLPGFEYRDIFIEKEGKIVPFEASSEEEAEKQLSENCHKLIVFIDEDTPKHLFKLKVLPFCDDIRICKQFKIENPYLKGIVA